MTTIRCTLMITTVCLAQFVRIGLAEEEAPETEEAQKELIAKLVETNGQLVAANLTMTKRIEDLTSLILETRESLKTALADRDDKLVRVVFLTDELHKMHDLVRRLEERQTQLVVEISRLEKEAGKGAAVAKPDPIMGVVLNVRKNFQEISIGSDDGVEEGDQFDVFRDQTFVARIIVRRTDSDRAVSEVIPGPSKKEIVKGDKIISRTAQSTEDGDE